MAKDFIQKAIDPKDEGQFSAKAKRAGMGTQEFARHVMANEDDYSSKTEKQANLARTLAKVRKHKRSKK